MVVGRSAAFAKRRQSVALHHQYNSEFIVCQMCRGDYVKVKIVLRLHVESAVKIQL